MNIVQRVRDILLSPRAEWPVIAAERHSIATLYLQYVAILAAIPAVAGFIGLAILGQTAHMTLLGALLRIAVGYVLWLAMVFGLGLLVDAFAPAFGGRRHPLQAFKVAAYSLTPAMVTGVFMLLPSLGVLSLLGALWSVWLLYNGLPVLMKVPQQKAGGYTAVVVVCGIVLDLVVETAITMLSRPGAV
ncbi:Yip1 family protein [Caldimonas brevitalea]|uniref:Membrane protein n=1 Tax=Caldimonas brevitalea TaxID=413882 RepID=A0A0G3BPS7_9BURK|nr:Yip1 family protein [Caldimonas brevitalea]AKJ31434.1 membrane protein [Caldimonas brevitalea]